MTINKDTNILIVGLGLMGGSYASALSKQGYKVRAITLEQKDIDYALERGMILEGATTPDEELIAQADLIVFALYPATFVKWIIMYQHLFRSGTLITDVTGVKTLVVNQVQGRLRSDVEYVSAHPMAGRERSGVEFSDDSVFKGANYIVTPTEKNTPEAVETCKRLGEILGFSRISVLSPEEHDDMIAFLSQLTHCIAVTLMTTNEEEGLEKYTGDSFRDLTRISKINDEMWSELFLMNKDALLRQMDAFSAEFARFREYVANGQREEMRAVMRKAGERRTKFDKK
ncbi:MAG: prephenate dehydrogenase [Clostridia bacterium]|nr:prephenate dehydrogenase [Clostridia bacterium]MBO7245350.1 prephenate dehydrogenase [Clostridia bacterium]MBO7738039.1 prephenate dehydrogenase [Clostridia bacterium]